MVMQIRVTIDFAMDRVFDIDDPKDLKELEDIDWYSQLIHLEENNKIVLKCISRDD